MKYQKSKFSLIFRIISLVLIQAFLVMDFAWAIGGEFPIINKTVDASTLAPKISLNSQEVLDAYLYRSNNSAKLNEVSLVLDQPIADNPDSPKLSRREFFKFAGKVAVGAAAVLTGTDLIVPVQVEARDLKVDLRNLVVSFDSGVVDLTLNKYIAVIESQGFKDLYTVEKNKDQTVIIIKGLFPLNAEKLSNALNAQAKVLGLSKSFVVTASEAGWEQSLTYNSMKTFANKVSSISSGLGFGEIDANELLKLYEGVTWVESKFNHWEVDAQGRIRPVRSYTNAIGVTQVIESQAVKQIANLIVKHKEGISRYSVIMNELERMIFSDSEKVKKAFKNNKEFIEETSEQKQFNVHADFIAYKNADLSIAKQKQIIQRIHRKINENPKLVGVNLYYALAVWEYLQKRNNLQAGVTAEIARSIGETGEWLIGKKGQLVKAGSGAYQPTDLAKANLQFERDYFRLNLLYQMINPEKIAELLRGDQTKIFDNMMQYLTQQMGTEIGNQKLGYTYLTLNWDRYRRFELNKTENNKYEFTERPLSYFKNKHNGFSPILAAAAAYNAGTGSVDNSLLNFGHAVDANKIPLWIKNMIGANPQNIREPINYLRVFLEDRFRNAGDLSIQEQNIKNELILEYYKRIYRVRDSFLETRDLIEKNGIKVYVEYNKRKDSFDYKLAALLAQAVGSDYVDSFLRTYGLDGKWEEKIFNKSTQTIDILAAALADKNSAGYKTALNLQQYLVQKQFTTSTAYLDERIAYFKSKGHARIARIELAKQVDKENEWQETKAVAESWIKRSAVGTAALAAAGGLAWIMNRRVKLGKDAVPAPMYRLPLRALGLLGYVTIRIFIISGKIIWGASKYVFGLFSGKKSQISKKRNSLMNSQNVVRRNRRNNDNNRIVSTANIKKVILGTIVFLVLTAPFTAPVFSYASQKQPQAPPAISLTQQQLQQNFKNELIEISKKSEHKQLDAAGELTTIRADILKNALDFSNTKSRERVKQINELVDRTWNRLLARGELHAYITKRGDTEEAIAVGKALLLMQLFDQEGFAALVRDNVPIYLANIPSGGYLDVRGMWRGVGGRPVIYLNKKFKDNIFWLADLLVHEGVHSDRLPKNLLDTALKHNLITLARDIWSASVPEEEDAFLAEANFIKNFKIIPINEKAEAFFDNLDLGGNETYYNYKWKNVLTDIAGTFLFNIIPLLIGGLFLKNRGSNGGNSYRRSGGSSLSNQRRSKIDSRVGNRFKSIILIPFIAFQFMNFFNPAIIQASDALIQSQQKTEIIEYKNEHIINMIPGTNIAINSHFGPQEGKHNNALGDWTEAVVNGVIQPNADIIHVDFHADDLGAVMDADMQALREVKDLETPSEKIKAVRDIASNIRIDSFYYPAYLTGPTGEPILGTTFWVRQEAEWQGSVRQQYIVSAPYGTFPTEQPEKYPNDRNIKRYDLNVKDLSAVGNTAQLKNGFILDIDLDYFTLHRTDMNWDYLGELLQKKDDASQKLAKSILKTVHYQPTRDQIQVNIDIFLAQLKQLHERGIDPGLISCFESPNFTGYEDAKWVNSQLVKGFEAIYRQDSSVVVKKEETKDSGFKKNGMLGILSVIAASFANLFSAVNLWALENGADKTFDASDLTSAVISLFIIGVTVFIGNWALKAIRSFRQNNLSQLNEVVVPSQTALVKIKKLEADISALFTQGKTRVVIAFDGPSGAGKTTLANYIKAVGIAGIQPSEIQVLSRDDYAVGGDYGEGNIAILEKAWHRGKLVILEGNGIQWASELLANDDVYAQPDIFVKITASEQLRKERLLAKGMSESVASGRIETASDPDSKKFDLIIEEPYDGINMLRKSAEYVKADSILKLYDNDPGLALTRQFTLDQMFSSDRRELILYHNERHFNELFEFFDLIVEHLPIKDTARTERLVRMAIYLHDLGYFYSENGLLSLNHEQRSKDKVREFAAENSGLLLEAEVDALIYMIDKTQLKIGDIIKNEISDDNKTYDLLNQINNGQETNLTADDWKFLADFLEKNFPNADWQNSQDRQLMMDIIFGGKTLALADIWGQSQAYLYQVALLSQEFRYDKQIMLDNNDPEVAKNPATMTNLEQVGETRGFQNFVQGLRLNFFLNSDAYSFMGMQQYLDAEQKAKEVKGEKEKALIDQRMAMIEKSKHIRSIINDLLNGVDQNLNILGLVKNTDDISQVKELKEFIEQAVALGIYDQAQKSQLISEINSRNGFIDRGMENQSKFELDFAFIPELSPNVNDVLSNSEFSENLSDQELDELIATIQIKQFAPGQEIIQQGVLDLKGVFLVISGDLDVFVNGYRVAKLSKGKLFGEMSAMENIPRTATVSVSPLASRPAEIAEIPVDVFRKLLNRNKQIEKQTKELIEKRKKGVNEIDKQSAAEQTETLTGEAGLKDKFENKQLDSVVFIDVDLMRLTNQYVAKKNVNVLLDVLEKELEIVIKDMGAKNAVSLRRGGDEFVLAINSQGNRQLAIEIAAKIKANVQNAKFAVASIGTDNLSAERITEIESFGCGIDKIGRHNIIIIAEKANGKTGRDCVQEFLNTVNVSTIFKNQMVSETKILSIEKSWLNRLVVANEVSFTLSMGIANTAEINEAAGHNVYEKTRNLAAQRKDKSKGIFKKLGDGHIESNSEFEPSSAAGESVLLSEQALADFIDFEQIQDQANQLESDGNNNGLRSESVPNLIYFSSENAARAQLNSLLEKNQLKGAIVFSLQALDYYDQAGKIYEYQTEYYDSPGAVKDNRVDIRDFKVVNEAYGYVAGDEIIARMRMGAMRFTSLFENFDIIVIRGPPAGPNIFLAPKTKQAEEMDEAQVKEMLNQYMQKVRNYFNQPDASLIKVGHFRIIGDRVREVDNNIGLVMQRISRTREVYEHTVKPETDIDKVIMYNSSISEIWESLQEDNAYAAVEQLDNLKNNWQQNKLEINALAIEQEISGSFGVISSKLNLLDKDISLKSGQSI